MTFSSLVVLFTICSFAGWVFESLHSIIRKRKWERRGFLYGPVCPIYGFGVVGVVLVFMMIGHIFSVELTWWQVFLVSFFGSMLLEYPTSYLLERWFHAYWWDYSNLPLNLHGRISVPTACVFGAGGWLAVYVIHPWWLTVDAALPPLAIEIAAYVIIILLTIDATLTVSALTDFQKIVDMADETFNERAGEITDKVISGPAAVSAAMGKIAQLGESEEDEQTEEKRIEFVRKRISSGIGQLGVFRASALRRVKGFRGTPRSEMLDQLVSLLKKRK